MKRNMVMLYQSAQLSLLFSAPSRQFCALRAVRAKAKLCLRKAGKWEIISADWYYSAFVRIENVLYSPTGTLFLYCVTILSE